MTIPKEWAVVRGDEILCCRETKGEVLVAADNGEFEEPYDVVALPKISHSVFL